MITRTAQLLMLMLLLPAVSAAGPGFGPKPDGGGFLVTDFITSYPMGPSGGISRKLDLSTELGMLFPLNGECSLGPAFNYGAWLNGGWHSRWGLSARGRRILNENLSLDLSAGLIIGDSPFPDGFAGFTTGASLVMDHWLSLCTRVDITEGFGGETETVVRIGLGLGQVPGLAATGAASAAGAIAYWKNQMD